jgi:hypothetical protein
MSRPVSLTIAVVLQWIAALVAILSGLDLIAAAYSMSTEGVADQIEATLVDQGIADVSGHFVVVGVFMGGVLVITIALVRIMAALYLARGRSWARILITALVGINLVSGFAFLFQGYALRAGLAVVVDLLVLWLLFNAQSSAYIRERSAA